ncbi:hypothetical protein T459_11297 [Capsicum annuum]|uniref:Protein kinase domain-containing protein n=1 Tax=Capsicum annuum TaxID=4072 RepID=A0A2G2ZLR0_CAPAN|nr:hypothetical protein T459_11297 [Capsicum annuum]
MSLSNASRLETLEISYNSLQGNILEWIGNLHNMKVLSIQANQLTGSIPFIIFNISRIEVVAFADNSLSGYLPNGLCNDLSILKGLHLSKNKLHGHMPTSLSNCSQLQILSLSDNEFDGPIHSEIGRLSNLQTLFLGFNQFNGMFLSVSHGDKPDYRLCPDLPIKYLITANFALSMNNFSGFLPREIGNLTKMQNLQLGEIPKEISNLVELEVLDLSGNSFSGSLDMEIFNISGLRVISISNNNLSGSLPPNMFSLSTNIEKLYMNDLTNLVRTIPHSISNCSELTILELSNNQLTGLIPNSLGHLAHLQDLQRFNLSSNKVTGFIGDHICKLQHLGDIYLDQNQLSGSLPNCLGNITSLREIHLGSNKLSSNIPPSLGNLQDLVVLDLSSNNMVDLSMNQFSNGIPTEIGGLQNLANLSLTHKKLQGAIPDSMSNMVGLEFQDLSHNNISGIIPKSLEKLQNLKYFNVSVNKLYVEIPSGSFQESLEYRRGKSAPQQAESLSTVTRERISHYELLQATDDLSESNLIGFGSFVSVYKGVLRSGTSIAVKVFNLQLDAAFKSFDTESDVLCSLRHRNLVKEYLHHGCSLPVNHCDVKPSNILLDEDMVAHLSDFVISKLLGEDQGDLYTKTLATLGNIAREYGLNGLVSTKCDVYSYGIMFLETFTRRKPYEFEGDLSLKHWVSYSLPEEVMDVVDVNFVTPIGNLLQKELDVVASIMKVALDCCAECPAKRTNMKDIVAMLQKVKIQLLAC